MKLLTKRVAAALVPAAILPLVAAAQIDNLLTQVKTTLGIVISILFVLMTLYFIWGVVQYITAGGDEEKLGKGKQHMIWGIIGMAVAGAAWGIVGIIWTYFRLNPGGPPTIPF
ncbi:pilin [Patescibacteria group bacterium]|nr:pilin [Patescibacteria group bacterium]